MPVVLIHGAGGNHLYWPSEIRRLPGFRVFALDLPGHGKSSGRGRQSIAEYSQSVLAWQAAMNLHRVIYVGHSMGGAVAQYIAVHYPEHVLGLGLIGTAARLRVNPVLLEETASETTYNNAIDKVISWSFSSDAPENLTSTAAKRMAEIRPSVLHGDFLACDGFDLTSQICEVRMPTLVVCGGKDKMTPVRTAQYLVDCIPGALFELIPNAGHMVMLERPQIVAAALLRFLAEINY